MPLETLIANKITGIRPFNELPIDAEIWKQAHNHHHLHRYLHAVGAHRPGVVTGLEVIASQVRERTVIVAPGVAIDTEGQTLVVSQPTSLQIDPVRGNVYVTLAFRRESDRNSAVTVGGGQEYYRELEGHYLVTTKELPKTAYIELARVYSSSADKPIKDAVNASAPAADEVNLLFRPLSFPHCYADTGIGELAYVPNTTSSPWNPNRSGLWNLLREGSGRGFHLGFTGTLGLKALSTGQDAGPEPSLAYMAGRQGFHALGDAEADGLKKFLSDGGLLFGEAGQGNAEFAAGFQELAGKVGAKLKKLPKNDPLLTAHYVFSSPPSGAQSQGEILADMDAGVIFSTYDYGAAWQGELEKPDAPDARERIRQAQEFGLNIVAAAAGRRRSRELARLG
ncbi:MAG: DUF4159 domain-containing protein [Janthinobacterium lividum]